MQPINGFFLLIFLCATIHTFFAHRFSIKARRIHPQIAHEDISLLHPQGHIQRSRRLGFASEALAFLGEVEVVFGIWCIPILIGITFAYDWRTALEYVNWSDYKEALFIIVAVATASTYPFMRLADKCMSWIANLCTGTPAAWWLIILTIGPLIGSLIKETIAMTISALMIGKYFFRYHPSKPLAYATLGLLFVNISIGGLLTNFASSSVTVAAKSWGWSTIYMLSTFGWKALLAIIASNLIYLYYFKEEFKNLAAKAPKAAQNPDKDINVPIWITCVHILFLAWLILNNNQPVIALGSFVLFLGFYKATLSYQRPMVLEEPIMIGFFLASLAIHAGLQSWWLAPLIERLNASSAMVVAVIISAFSRNTPINALAIHLPNLDETIKYALFCGTMAGGGLTIMANSPNLIGYSILGKYFGHTISFVKLFAAALIPTIIAVFCFTFF